MSILVIDVGTSGLRASVVRDTGAIEHLRYEAFAPQSPAPGLVEFDAQLMRDAGDGLFNVRDGLQVGFRRAVRRRDECRRVQ